SQTGEITNRRATDDVHAVPGGAKAPFDAAAERCARRLVRAAVGRLTRARAAARVATAARGAARPAQSGPARIITRQRSTTAEREQRRGSRRRDRDRLSHRHPALTGSKIPSPPGSTCPSWG